MSLQRDLLNRCLRWTEKPLLSRGSPQVLRHAFELQARLLFRGPRAVRADWRALPGTGRALWLTPPLRRGTRVILYIHGGGFVFGSPRTHQGMLAHLARLSGAEVILPPYARAPEARFPAAAWDVRAAWDGVLRAGIAPSDIVLGGDSAGGALVFDLLAQLCREDHARPAGVFGLSPLLDLTFSGQSFVENAARDMLLPAARAAEMAQIYLKGQSADDPRASPLYADFPHAPPVWLAVSDSEILRDDSRRLAARLRRQHGQVVLHEASDLPHVWPLFYNHLPEARRTLKALSDWVTGLPRTPCAGPDRGGES